MLLNVLQINVIEIYLSKVKETVNQGKGAALLEVRHITSTYNIIFTLSRAFVMRLLYHKRLVIMFEIEIYTIFSEKIVESTLT